MPISFMLHGLWLFIAIFMGSFAYQALKQEQELNTATFSCLEQMALDSGFECEKELRVRAKVLEATASALLPKT